MNQNRISISQSFDETPDRLWKALTDQNEMQKWYFQDAEFKPEVGFSTEFNVHHEGKDFLHIWKVTEVIPLKKIAYEWRYGGFPGNSLLTFELTPEQGKTTLELTHENLNSFDPDNNPELSSDNFVEGWKEFLQSLLPEYLKHN